MKRIADYMGILFRSRLVKFASKEEMVASEDPVIRQFLEGRPDGPIGMDEMADDPGPPGATFGPARPTPAVASDRGPAGAGDQSVAASQLPLIVPIPDAKGKTPPVPASRALTPHQSS